MAELTPEEAQAAYLALPPGWTAGCRAEDEAWVAAYVRDFPASISNPVDLLPAGYEAYVAVLHQLVGADDQPRAWITDPLVDPWRQIRQIVDHGLDGWPYAADTELTPPQSSVLVTELGLLTASTLFTCGFFFAPYESCTVTGAALARTLNGDDYHQLPQLWFPHSREWVASAPYDAGWTYLACDAATATRLTDNAMIEVIACTFDVGAD